MNIITLTYNDYKKKVLSELAFVGKRQQAVKNDPLFSVSSFSTAEDIVVESAIASAATALLKEIKEYVVNFYPMSNDAEHPDKTTGLTIAIENTRSQEDFESAISLAFESFIVSFAVATILAKTSPDLAKPFADEAQTFLASAVSLTCHKLPPSVPPYDISDVHGAIVLDEDGNIPQT